MVAISFSLVYATTKIFHVAHAGIYTLGGYLAWSLMVYRVPLALAFLVPIAACAAIGALIQSQLYARLERRRATHLVVLIASLGMLAVMQNIIAAVYTPNILQFPLAWSSRVVSFGAVRLNWTQMLTIVVEPGGLCRHHAVRASHHPGQAHPRRRVQPDARRHHAAAAADRLYLRHRHRLGAGVPAGHTGAARSRPAAL